MTHPEEDKLLEYALEIIDDHDELARIENHLNECPTCTTLLRKIKNDIKIIADIQPVSQIIPVPGSRQSNGKISAIFKIAAVFIFGIFVGYGASMLAKNRPVPVSPAYITLSPQSDSLGLYAVSDATDIPDYYYTGLKQND
jgi:hypothetical protein